VERKNKMKKTIKKKKEANKSPCDHIYSGSCWRVYQVAAVQSILNTFSDKICVFFFAVSHCSEFHLSTHSGN